MRTETLALHRDDIAAGLDQARAAAMRGRLKVAR
jgi:hypothetical protein